MPSIKGYLDYTLFAGQFEPYAFEDDVDLQIHYEVTAEKRTREYPGALQVDIIDIKRVNDPVTPFTDAEEKELEQCEQLIKEAIEDQEEDFISANGPW